ncbi:zf-TFIIB domain-containing protein [Pyrobaculum ferrireducens]|uniref:Transcription factor zinc-finger domain-containing protein n=1 Tax=Pyrobaculum ferrireducens TaxID=1104324 RepID=G7VAQ5_9CREN|nr:zf-TFIIB domain-containing protein [Pyrobaculum ferrireducens]AET33483.1 hypothetical protein P186_2091 [Pyrobaculum ferrireducens]
MPLCGIELKPRIVYDIEIDACPKCGGVWLDGGELQKLMARVKEYRDEYYSHDVYKRWEEEYKYHKKRKSVFEFFEDLFD